MLAANLILRHAVRHRQVTSPLNHLLAYFVRVGGCIHWAQLACAPGLPRATITVGYTIARWKTGSRSERGGRAWVVSGVKVGSRPLLANYLSSSTGTSIHTYIRTDHSLSGRCHHELRSPRGGKITSSLASNPISVPGRQRNNWDGVTLPGMRTDDY